VDAPSNRRKKRRSSNQYTGYMDLLIELVETKSSSFDKAVEKPIWVDAMVEEYESIVNNSVWEVVPRPEEKSVVGLIWIFKVKHAADGSIEKYKARFFAKGYTEVEGLIILALTAHMGWKIHHVNAKTTFLNGVIEEEMYLKQPEDFNTFGRESHVCRIKQPFHGLKKPPYSCYTRIDSYLISLGFTKCEVDANLYQILVVGKLLIIFLYVDDLILTDDEQLIISCKEELAREFEMKDMGLMDYFLRL